MKKNIPYKKVIIICGICAVMVTCLSIFVPKVIKHNSVPSPEEEHSLVEYEDYEEYQGEEIPIHGVPDISESMKNSKQQTPYDLQLSEDAVKYGVSEISGTFTTFVNLNFREGPSTNYDIISTSPKGSKIAIIGRASNGWYQVVIDNVIGYMCDEYLDGQGKLELNTFNMDNVVELAMKKAKSYGVGTIEDWLEQRVKDGRMSPDEYALLTPSGKGTYYCAAFEVSSKNFCTCDGTTLTSEDAIAEYLVNRFLTIEVENCYFENAGIFTIGGKSYYEIRCYTKSGKSDFAKEVENYISSSDYEEDLTNESETIENGTEKTDVSEEVIDYNNQYSE